MLWTCLTWLIKQPDILPGYHHLISVYVRRAHARVLHNGTKETLTELRSQFWVIKGRSMVKRIIHNSYICWRHERKPCLVIPPPPLPAFCVREAPPFTKTSVDFAGLLYVKSSSGGQSKVWIALHTCRVTRHLFGACSGHVHPRIYPKLQEIQSRRGFPSLILSGNGKTFEAAA